MFSIAYSRQADRFLAKQPNHLKIRLKKKISELKTNPVPQNAIRLKDSEYFRIRIGKYRVLYEKDNKTIGIIKIDKRSRIY